MCAVAGWRRPGVVAPAQSNSYNNSQSSVCGLKKEESAERALVTVFSTSLVTNLVVSSTEQTKLTMRTTGADDKELAALMAADAVPERSKKPGKGREAGFTVDNGVTIGGYIAGV